MQRRIPVGFAAVLLAFAAAVPACDGDTETSPSEQPTLTAGEIVASPAGAGLAEVTAVTFTGTADDQFEVFTGTMTPGGAAVLARCGGPGGC